MYQNISILITHLLNKIGYYLKMSMKLKSFDVVRIDNFMSINFLFFYNYTLFQVPHDILAVFQQL